MSRRRERFLNEPVRSTWRADPTSTCSGPPSRRGTVCQNIPGSGTGSTGKALLRLYSISEYISSSSLMKHYSRCWLFILNCHFFSPILREGNLTEARRVLAAIEKTVPGLAVVRLRRVALERRAGQLDRSEALLQEAVAESKEKPTLHAFYSIKLARLLLKLGRNPSKARKVLQEALEISPVRLTFILKQYFHLSLHHMHIVSHTHRHRIPTRLNPLFLSLE